MLGRVPGVRLAAQSLARRSGPLVLFDSWRGAYSDNPRAVSETLHALRPELPQVWVGDGPDHAERVAAGSRAHLRALGAATHVVTNLEMPGYFRKRADTVYVQTWHGTPVKKLAFDVADPHFAPNARYMRRLARDIADWDFLVSPNPFSTRLFRQAFRYEGAVLETGYPRNDLLRAPDAAAIRERVRAQLGIEGRAVLYMPTWRDSAAFELELDFARLQAPGTTLLFRAHHKAPVGVPDGVIDVTRHPDNRELYLAADVLITDYSSAVFDFAVTGKPILLYLYDLAYYRDELRGLYLDLTTEAPGPVLETSEAVAGALADLEATSARYADAYERFAERFCALEDGRAAERVIDAVF
jgi:CDP-glycerol glycerophosphotransferase